MHDEDHDVAALRRQLADTEQRLAELQQRLTSRRHMLRLGGATAVGAAAALVGGGGAAHATTGTMQYGAANNAGTDETELSASSQLFTLRVNNSSQFASALSVVNSSSGTGVDALVDPGTNARAVEASVNGANGYALAVVGGRSQVYFGQGFDAGPSVSATHSVGELAVDSGSLWFCVTAGNPGVWRRLASTQTAGSFHPLPTARVYDSRWNNILPNVTKGSMVVGNASRLVYCDDQRALDTGLVTQADVVPAGATAIAYNLTLTQASGQGFLAVEPGGASTYGGSAINWTANVSSVANASVAKLDSQRRISVFIGGQPGALTHFIVDVVGYYR